MGQVESNPEQQSTGGEGAASLPNGVGSMFIPRGSSADKNAEKCRMYQLVDVRGGGDLVKWTRNALRNGDFSLVEGVFETTIKDMMYNDGKGKLEAVSELVKRRNRERNERLAAFRRKKGKGKSGPNILEQINQGANQGDLQKGASRYREIVWKLEERGALGENILNACLMQGGPAHKAIARRLVLFYPKLVNDVMLSEDYYGLSPLHQAIVNEDPAMVSFLLRNGADVNQRCYGALFTPEDQKNSRVDSLEHEFVELSRNTNYNGRMYFGEYPLAYAACIDQVDCFRMLRACRADPNQQDTNGNTVLHMTVIHEKSHMFRLCYEMGGAKALNIQNKQSLTPLTLAAKLAKKNVGVVI